MGRSLCLPSSSLYFNPISVKLLYESCMDVLQILSARLKRRLWHLRQWDEFPLLHNKRIYTWDADKIIIYMYIRYSAFIISNQLRNELVVGG